MEKIPQNKFDSITTVSAELTLQTDEDGFVRLSDIGSVAFIRGAKSLYEIVGDWIKLDTTQKTKGVLDKQNSPTGHYPNYMMHIDSVKSFIEYCDKELYIVRNNS